MKIILKTPQINSFNFSDQRIQVLEQHKQQLLYKMQKIKESNKDLKTKKVLIEDLKKQIEKINNQIKKIKLQKLKNKSQTTDQKDSSKEQKKTEGNNSLSSGTIKKLISASSSYSELEVIDKVKNQLEGEMKILTGNTNKIQELEKRVEALKNKIIGKANNINREVSQNQETKDKKTRSITDNIKDEKENKKNNKKINTYV